MTPQVLTLSEASHGKLDEVRIFADRSLLAALVELAKAVAAAPDGDGLARLLARRIAAITGEVARETQVLDAMLPPVETLTDVATTQLRWNALARESALREFGALTSAQLAEARGSSSTNPHTTTSRWQSANKVFAIDTPTGRLFPAFQFEHGEPRPVIGRVLAALAGQLRGWELLAWFTGSNGYLDGARPVDLLSKVPDEVIAAAAYQASLSDD